MSELSLHFSRTRDLASYERALVRSLLLEPAPLAAPHESLYRYALNLAQIGWLRTDEGKDIALSEALQPFRSWLKRALEPAFKRSGPEFGLLHRLAPEVAVRTESLRTGLIDRYCNTFSSRRLDEEVSTKKLGLVLGGGGGAGFAHLGAFSLLHELSIIPEYVIGTSLGSLVGLIRVLQRDYDGMAALLTMPRGFDVRDMLSPFGGRARFGLPGLFDLNVLPMASKVSHTFQQAGIPPFDALPIHFEVMATGIRSGFPVDERRLEKSLKHRTRSRWPSFLNVLQTRRLLKTMLKVTRLLLTERKFLKEIVFNQTPGTHAMRITDAIGFSCSVPGVLHYDTLSEPPEITEPLAALFHDQDLAFFVDGGVVANVPSKAAWESIQKGSIGHRNVFLFALDPFAPIPNANANALFLPLQQLARPSVVAQRPYADLNHTLRTVPNPVNLAPGFEVLQRVVGAVRRELVGEAPFLERMMRSLPPFERWLKDLCVHPSLFWGQPSP